MATGIISVGLYLTGHQIMSLSALGLDEALWLLLAAAFADKLFRDRDRWTAEAATPPALTAVAATTVLGTRLSLLGWQNVAAALLALAVLLWPGLLINVVRRGKRHMPGGVFLICVATQGLAVLSGRLAVAYRCDWLGWAALVFFCLGLPLYVLALTRFDFRQIFTGAGDQWVAAGALSISAMAGSQLLASPQWTGNGHTVLRAAALALLALALTWYAVLLCAEVYRPRLAYDVRRWATVFPLGMTSVASLSLAGTADIRLLERLGHVLLWIAVGAWLLTFAGLIMARAGAGDL
ncbi:tellurite resistance/C4-dicarboxylate transporter family protein [Streptomyces sp. NPDC002205]|uniref:tellurite resistance/C4-dicarboxylate transporter family protein n=1 Tax=Streptomyces sp. NPDC002205 TaxID=3154411 RepID=UPI00332773BC